MVYYSTVAGKKGPAWIFMQLNVDAVEKQRLKFLQARIFKGLTVRI